MRQLNDLDLLYVGGGQATAGGTPNDIRQLEVGATGMGDDYHYTGVAASSASPARATISDGTAEALVNCVAGITAESGGNSYDCVRAMIGAILDGR